MISSRKYLIVVIAASTALLCAALCYADEEEFKTAPAAAHWLWNFITIDAARETLLWALAAVAGYIGNRWQGAKRAMTFLEAAVRDTYETYVRAVKAAAPDGKLTENARRDAVRLCIDKAVAIAKDEGFDLLAHYGKYYLPVLIDRIVHKFQAENAAGHAVDAEDIAEAWHTLIPPHPEPSL